MVKARWQVLIRLGMLLAVGGMFPSTPSLADATSYVRIIGEDHPLIPNKHQPVNTPSSPGVTEEEIAAKIRLAQAFYRAKYKKVAERVDELFQTDFLAMTETYQEKRKEMSLKISITNRIQDERERKEKLDEISQEYQEEGFQRYLEIFYYFENEMQKDHQFLGEFLELLEEALDLLIKKEMLLDHVFHSDDFRTKHGIVLKRVVWPTEGLKDLAADTVPLDVRTMFADSSKTPLLIRITVTAFDSVPFLRAVLMHQVSNLYFYKQSLLDSDGLGEDAEAFMAYLKQINPQRPSYDDFLLYEAYGYKTRIYFNDKTAARPGYALEAKDLEYFRAMLEWTLSQIEPGRKRFIENHPNPPAQQLIEKYY